MEDIDITQDELTQQIEELRQKIDALSHGVGGEEKEPECVSWNFYEEAIANDPLSFIRAHMDTEETSIAYIKRRKIPELKGCLRFFPGSNLTEKKGHLLTFVRHFAGYRTKNIRLLEQRLYLTNKWLKEHNIPCKLNDLYMYFRQQNRFQ